MLPWYLYQKPDLRSAALIHCTTDLEADWNRALGFSNVFVAPLGTTLPDGRACGPPRAAIDATTKDALNRDFDRRAMAEKKVEEWLAGVDDETFDAALEKLVGEKVAAGEYRFKRPEERELAMSGARQFYRDFSRKLISLSDGRIVYFVPDVRARDRKISNARAWAEYAFHAVSTGGEQVPGKSYFIRHFSDVKCENLALVESTIRAEHCVAVIERDRPERDAIHFVGISAREKRFDVITRLDEYGNANANLSEVTVVMTKKKYSEKNPPPEFRPLTEVVEAVAKHQAAGFSPSTTEGNIANPSSPRKGGGEKKVGGAIETEGRNSRSEANGLHRWREEPRTLLYVGRIYPVKALDNAIRAIALMKNPIKLRIVGPDQAGHMAELMSLCDSINLPYTKPGESNSTLHLLSPPTFSLGSQVQFVGPKYDSDLDQEYWTCDGLILVSHTENFGATVVDALAHSKPVITSTNTPWKVVLGENTNPQPLTPNPLASGRCGWWVDNTPESLARTFDAFASTSTTNLNLFGQNGLALVKQSYTWPAIAQNLIKRYEELRVGS